MNRLRRVLAVALTMSLVACGGGGSSTPAPTPPAAGTISYVAPPGYTVGTAIAALSPTITGTVSSFTVSPQLPAGLAINSTTGSITGTPTANSASKTYTVGATSAGSAISTTVVLFVTGGVDPPSFVYSKFSWLFVKENPVPPNIVKPTVTNGANATFTISPALPAGLQMDPTNGSVSGNPTAVSPQTDYVVTGTNAGGSSTAPLVIQVNDGFPGFSYPKGSYELSKDEPVTIVPTTAPVATWAVTPALPTGLSFNNSTGVISGTPTSLSPPTEYTVTTTNTGGTGQFRLSLSVAAGQLLDVGHAGQVGAVIQNGQRILSLDFNFQVVLWNAVTGAIIAKSNDEVLDSSGGLSCGSGCQQLLGLAGNTAVIQSNRVLIVLDSNNGAELARLQSPSTVYWWRLASDGSYIAAATATQLNVWSRSGTLLFTKAANYGSGKPFAAATELRIGGGPAGANNIETLTLPAGTSSISAVHQGAFHSWFDDGEKFFSTVGSTVWIYSRAVAQLDFLALPTITLLTGQGEWFWTRSSTEQLNIYRVGSSATPAYTQNLNSGLTILYPSRLTIGVLPYGTNSMSVIDLSGGTPTKADYTGPSHYFTAFAAASKDDWVVAAMQGVMLGEFTATPQIYSFGQIQSIDANASDIVVATAAGHILDYDAQTRALKRDIPYLASKVEISADGSSVVVAPTAYTTLYAPVRNLRVYSLTNGAVLNEWAYPDNGHLLYDFDVADAADALAQVVDTDDDQRPHRIITTLAGAPIWESSSIVGGNSVVLSPDGTMSAINAEMPPQSTGTVNLYANGTLSGALPGQVGGWLDNARLVVNRFKFDRTFHADFEHVDLMNTTQTVLASFNIYPASSIQTVSANSFYVPDYNKIYDATTGAVLFSTLEPRGVGSLSGTNVVYATGSLVRISPR